MQRHIKNGFTLIELLVVVAIVGILAGIAYPSYQESLVKARRADAKAALSQLSNFMEQLYTATGCYNPGPNKVCDAGGDDAAPTLPFTVTPTSGTAYYDLSLSNVTASSFTLAAAPKTNQADKCGSLTLNNAGVKAVTNSYGYTVADCW